jgi:molybdopterin molybdotransferase
MSASPCDNPATALLSVEETRQRIGELFRPLTQTETLDLPAALDRVLAVGVSARMAVPPFDNSAMDGYALRSADVVGEGVHALQVIGEIFAGKPFQGELGYGQCLRIMTGAVIPRGADAVVMQEEVRVDGEHVLVPGPRATGENVRRAGEDRRAGSEVVAAGERLGAAELGLIASVGVSRVEVFRRPRVAFCSTGDELRPVEDPLEVGQIYDSNRYTLRAMLTRIGMDWLDLGVVPDDPDAVREAFVRACRDADVVITTGGVSVGEADYVKRTLDELGEVAIWRIAMKPGKPLAVGHLQDALFFGLPGNPVSVMATFYQFVREPLLKLAGQRHVETLIVKARTSTPLRKQPGRLEYQRGVLAIGSDGDLTVSTTGAQGSHVLSSMRGANCFIILPREAGDIEAGASVQVQPFSGLV